MIVANPHAYAALVELRRVQKTLEPVDQAPINDLLLPLLDAARGEITGVQALVALDEIPYIEFDDLGASCDVYSVIGAFRMVTQVAAGVTLPY